MPKSKRKVAARRGKQQRIKKLAKAREDCQLNGDIETTPAGAVRNERVDPVTQGSQPLPGPVREALSRGWATPEHVKPQVVDEMVGIVTDPDMFPGFRIQAARVLQQGDQQQWERDHPEEAGKVKGGTKVDVNVSNNNQINLLEMVREQLDPLEEAKKRSLESNKPDEPV